MKKIDPFFISTFFKKKIKFPLTAIRETKILQSLNHPNIIKLIEVITHESILILFFCRFFLNSVFFLEKIFIYFFFFLNRINLFGIGVHGP